MEGIRPIQAINAVGPDNPILEFHILIVGAPIDAQAQEDPGLLNGKVSKSFDFVDEKRLVKFEVILHVDLGIMQGVLLVQIILVDELDGHHVFFGEPTFSDGLLPAFHQVYPVDVLAISPNQIMEMLLSRHIQNVIISYYNSRSTTFDGRLRNRDAWPLHPISWH